MPPQPLNCAACRAPLPAPDGDDVVTCTYCGQTHDLRGHRIAPPHEPGPTAGAIPALAVLIPLIGAGLGLAGALIGAAGPGAAQAPIVGPIVAPLLDAAVDTHWDDVGGAPVIAQAGGREVAIGRVRVGLESKLFIDAYATADGARVWRAGPYDTYGDAYRAVWFVVSGARVVVTDMRGRAHLLDLATGEEQGIVALTDRVERLCPQGDRVRAEQLDARNVLLDPATGRVDEEATGPECRADEPTRPRSLKLPGVEVQQTLRVGDVDVALGVRHPGTPTPKIAALVDGQVRWEAWVPSVDPATVREDSKVPIAGHGGRVYTVYGVGSEAWRAVAFDVATGDRVWEVPLRGIFAVDWIREAVATDTRVLFVRMSSVDVLDARDGRLVATLGVDPYDE